MANYEFVGLGESQIFISGGGQLSGITQGDGSHLFGRTLTIVSKNFEEIRVRDNPRSDNFFDDNDSDQRTRGRQTDFDGETYGRNTIIEAEYSIFMLDPNTGIEYQAVGINFREAGSDLPSYATVEGPAFVDVIPPANVPLQIVRAEEGPGDFGQPAVEAGDIAAPPCFTPGTLIRTPDGARAVEKLQVGDLVETYDRGPQPIRWIGSASVGPFRMAISPGFRPIRIRQDAFGKDRPARDLLVSPQHRVLVEGWNAELLYGEPQVLVAAAHLVNDRSVVQAWGITQVTYLHIQFDHHELIWSDDLLTESFNPGPMGVSTLDSEARAELEALFPGQDLTDTSRIPAVRPMITRREAMALRSVP